MNIEQEIILLKAQLDAIYREKCEHSLVLEAERLREEIRRAGKEPVA